MLFVDNNAAATISWVPLDHANININHPVRQNFVILTWVTESVPKHPSVFPAYCDKSPPSMCRHVMPGTVYCMPADMPPCWNAWLVCFLMCSAQHSRSVLLFCEIWFCPGLMKLSAWIQIRIVIQDFYWHHHGNSFTKKNKNNTKHTGINNTHKNAV